MRKFYDLSSGGMGGGTDEEKNKVTFSTAASPEKKKRSFAFPWKWGAVSVGIASLFTFVCNKNTTDPNAAADKEFADPKGNKSGEVIKFVPDTLSNFGFNSSAMTPEQYSTLAQIAYAIQATNTKTVQITGTTCHIGKASYNLRLSYERAEAVAKELADLLGPGSDVMITAKGVGEGEPFVEAPASDNPEAKRAVIIEFGPK
jgi:outer membrane protein OmpA-like peptidoglycan-associated protein